jgi:hypothetical protein
VVSKTAKTVGARLNGIIFDFVANVTDILIFLIYATLKEENGNFQCRESRPVKGQ